MKEDLSEFFSVISEEMKKQEEWNSHFKPPDFSNEINSLVETISKVDLFKSTPKKKIKKVKTKKIPVIVEQKTETEVLIDTSINFINEEIKKQSPKPQQDSNSEIKHLKDLVYKLVRDVSAQGGGGETRLEFLDDVDRNSAKVNHKFLRYDSETKKWVGSDANQGPFISSTTYVTSSSYTILEEDYYIGVNYAGAVTITLPSGSVEGTTYIVKDERGEASKGMNRYITIFPSGSDLIDGQNRVILAYDFGSLTFVYRNGWRVV